jgi:hypothetical protein
MLALNMQILHIWRFLFCVREKQRLAQSAINQFFWHGPSPEVLDRWP